MKRQPQNKKRRGVVAPLTGVLMVPLLGMCAFSIDAGYIILVQTDLQNAADAGALAGADRLQNQYVAYNSPGANQAAVLTQATTNVAPSGSTPGSPMYTAEQFAYYNKAGGVNISVRDQDVVFGYTDANGNYSSTYVGFPNTIDVTTRRDDIKNTPVSLFFGPVFNKSTQALTATARATIYAGDITSFKVIPGVDAHILPVALDKNIWYVFATTGLSPDGQIYRGPNGNPQLNVYPFTTNTPGSFGLIDVGPPQNNAPAFRQWIDDGQTPNDIRYLLDHNMLPVSLQDAKDWKVGPGLKSTLLTDFQAQIDKPNLIPLFRPVSPLPGPLYQAANGQGENATYAVVGFVGVTISEAYGNGNANMQIFIQPHGSIDPTSVIPPPPGMSQPPPAGTTLTQFLNSPSTFISAKLTR